MPIEVYCDSCQKKLRVPDTAAGKRIKCPKCQGVISVPAVANNAAPTVAPTTPAVASKSSSSISVGKTTSTAPKSAVVKSPLREQWHVQTEDGQQYGPVSRQELDQWYADGRITADTQLLKDGGDQWQWATDIYPDLLPPDQAPAASASGGFPDFGAMASSGGGSAASGSGPFDFSAGGGASTSSVTTRTKGKKGGGKKGRGKKGGGSPQIDYLGYTCYAMGGLALLFGLLFMVAGGSMAAMIAGADAEGAGAAGGTVGAITMFVFLFCVLISAAWFGTGWGLLQRAGWARIVMLVLAALNILSFPLGTAIGIWAFMVLLDKDNAAAFS